MSKKNIFSNTIFYNFFLVLASQNGAKINEFSNICRKRRFCKNRAPVQAGAQFLRFGASQKPPKIDARIEFEKQLEKKLPKIDLGLHFGSQKPPQTTPKPKKSSAETKLKNKLQHPNAPELASTGPTPKTKPKRPPKSHPFT